ncbi:hypothetical protein RHMOL_Rhmol01G0159700 [Rhododendron molle]|uniref:Uncharacterized protein n=1 Tax=Rhododendron molle TaxID=49168 RepID=A0ACC0Q3B7_RHOML|nr:hypothetical protein RHMOL_Rhmol01G0159700 [Rhododendron molle]
MVVNFSSGANWCWLLMDRSIGFQSSKLHSELLHWFWQRIKAILTRFHRFVSLSDLSTIPSSSTNFQVLFFFLRSVAFDFFFLFWNFCLRS